MWNCSRKGNDGRLGWNAFVSCQKILHGKSAGFTLFVITQYDILEEQTADTHHIDRIEGLDERFAKHVGELEGPSPQMN